MRKTRFIQVLLAFVLGLVGLWFFVSLARWTSSNNATAAPLPTLDYFLPFVAKSVPYDWLQFNGDASHTGNNTLESRISQSNVSSLSLLFQVALPAAADGSPIYLSRVSTPSGVRDLVFVTSRAGHIAALDAKTGALVWMKHYGPGGCIINHNLAQNESCYTTSSPAIDPGRQYVYSYGLDGYVHKLSVGDGTEIQTGGWPELVTLKGYDEKGSSALVIATANNGTSYLYVAHAGFPGDQGNYQGHLTTINLADGTQKVFNTICSNQTVHFVDSRVTNGQDCYPNTMTGIWARPGVVYDPYHDRILMTTGNGTFLPASFLWGDTVFALHPNGSGDGNGNPIDSYTPTNYQDLQNTDTDIGSTAPVILPPASGTYPHLTVQGGKDGNLRLLNLDLLSGQNGAGHTGGELFTLSVPMGGAILTQPAVWSNPLDNRTWIFVSNGAGIAGLQLSVDTSGNPSLQSKWTKGGGTSPIVANGVLFYANGGLVSALNPTDGSLLWSDNRIGGIHWESPMVANGTLYITDQSGNLTAYSIP